MWPRLRITVYSVTQSQIQKNFPMAAVMVFTIYTNTAILILFPAAQCDGLHSRAVLVVRGDDTRLCEPQRSTRHQRRWETHVEWIPVQNTYCFVCRYKIFMRLST